jgi:hypothetical protein
MGRDAQTSLAQTRTPDFGDHPARTRHEIV